MDYTAIIVALVSLFGMVFQSIRNGKMVKRTEIVDGFKKTQSKLDLISRGQEYVLQDRLLYLCERYIDKGYVTAEELKLLTNMYHVYHDLGGNDFITELFERTKELPLEERRHA